MVIIELIGSLSLAITFVIVMTLTIIYIRNKQNDFIYMHDNDMKMNHIPEENIQLEFTPTLQEFNLTTINRKSSIINVIDPEKASLSSIKYGIQWKIPTDEDIQSETIDSSLTNIPMDSFSFGDQSVCVRNLIEKFENNPLEEKIKIIESNLTSIDTNFDSQTMQTDRNQNQQKMSHRSSISNLDITVPSNLSSSIDLEQFECFSTTSNLSEFL